MKKKKKKKRLKVSIGDLKNFPFIKESFAREEFDMSKTKASDYEHGCTKSQSQKNIYFFERYRLLMDCPGEYSVWFQASI